MKLSILIYSKSRKYNAVARALVEGCIKHGDCAEIFDFTQSTTDANDLRLPSSDAVCCWGWGQGQRLRKRGYNVLIMELAYLTDRNVWVSLGWNGLNGRALFPRPDDGGKRWRQHFAQLIHPWKTNTGGYALLLGQLPRDKSVRMIKYENWLNSTAIALAELGHIVRFRPHPKAHEGLMPAPHIGGSLIEALAGAKFAVTWNSNSSVDAALFGTPTVTFDQGAMAWDITSHDLGSPIITPDREVWSHRMAYTQWLPLEISCGDAWEHLRQLI